MRNARISVAQLVARLPKRLHPTLWTRVLKTPQNSKPICDLVTDVLEYGADSLVLRLLPQ